MTPIKKISIFILLLLSLFTGASRVMANEEGVGPSSIRNDLPFKAYLPLILTSDASAWLQNGGFEEGDNGAWQVYSFQDLEIIYKPDPDEPQPHSGSYFAWMGGLQNEVTTLSQTVHLSPDTPYLHFWYAIYSDDTGDNDFLTVEINGAIIYFRVLNTSATNMNWTEATLDLTGYVDQTIEILFKVRTNDSSFEDPLGSDFFLDDVSLLSYP